MKANVKNIIINIAVYTAFIYYSMFIKDKNIYRLLSDSEKMQLFLRWTAGYVTAVVIVNLIIAIIKKRNLSRKKSI